MRGRCSGRGATVADSRCDLLSADVGDVYVDPHGDPWVRLPGGAVEIVMRPSSACYAQAGSDGPRRIFHPDEILMECANDFGPFRKID